MAQAWQHVAFDSLACCVSDAEHPLLDMMGTRQEVCLTIETLRAVNDSLMALEAYAKQDAKAILYEYAAAVYKNFQGFTGFMGFSHGAQVKRKI